MAILCGALACLLLPWAVSWAPADQGLGNDEGEIEIGHLVTSQVQTQAGYMFARYFNDYWTSPEGLGSINVVIQERASPIWGSLIWVKVNDAIVFRQIFSSRAKDMKDVAKGAVELVMHYILTSRLGNESNFIDDGPMNEL
jgi:hypothetical protein